MTPRFGTAALIAAPLAQSLGWSPTTFWDATPAELRTALGINTERDASLGAVALHKLMEAFPDG